MDRPNHNIFRSCLRGADININLGSPGDVFFHERMVIVRISHRKDKRIAERGLNHDIAESHEFVTQTDIHVGRSVD